jgi:hypothetical protein
MTKKELSGGEGFMWLMVALALFTLAVDLLNLAIKGQS